MKNKNLQNHKLSTLNGISFYCLFRLQMLFALYCIHLLFSFKVDGQSMTLIPSSDSLNNVLDVSSSIVQFKEDKYVTKYDHGFSYLYKIKANSFVRIPNPDSNANTVKPFLYNNDLYAFYSYSNKCQLVRLNDSKLELIPNPDNGKGFNNDYFFYNTFLYGIYQNINSQYQLIKFDGLTCTLTGTSDTRQISGHFIFNDSLYLYYDSYYDSTQIAKYDGNSMIYIANPKNGNIVSDLKNKEIVECSNSLFFIIYIFENLNSNEVCIAKCDGTKITLIHAPKGSNISISARPFKFNDSLYIFCGNQLAKYNDTDTLCPIKNCPYDITPIGFEYENAMYFRYTNRDKNNFAKFDGRNFSLISNPDNGKGIDFNTNLELNGIKYFRYLDLNNKEFLGKLKDSSLTLMNYPNITIQRIRPSCQFRQAETFNDFLYNEEIYFSIFNGDGNFQIAKFNGTEVKIIDNPENEDFDSPKTDNIWINDGYEGFHYPGLNEWMIWTDPTIYDNRFYCKYSYSQMCSMDMREYYTAHRWARLDSIISVPDKPSSHLTFDGIKTNECNITWQEGTGSTKVVFVCEGDNCLSVSDGISYSSDPRYGYGAQIGSKCYCVYKGLATSVKVSNLSSNTKYAVKVFDYNGAGIKIKYNQTNTVGNPDTFWTKKYCPIFIFDFPLEKKIDDLDFYVHTEISDGSAVEYSSSDTMVAKITNGLIHIIGKGTTIITAKNCLNSISRTLTVYPLCPTFSFPPIPIKRIGDPDFAPVSTSDNSAVKYSSSNTDVATIENGLIHIKRTGVTDIQAVLECNVHLKQQLMVEDTISCSNFSTTEFPIKKVGDANFIAGPGHDTNGSFIQYSCSDNKIATIFHDSIIQINGSGVAKIMAASYIGNNTYCYKIKYLYIKDTIPCPSITFPSLPSKKIGDIDFNPGAILSNNSKVVYISSDTTVAEIVNGLIHIVGIGNSKITATISDTLSCLGQNSVTNMLIVDLNNSTHSFENNNLNFFPNPSGDIIKIESDNPIDEIIVCDLYGKIMDHYQFNDKVGVIDVSKYISGIYLVRVKLNNRAYLKKIVKI